MLDLNKMKAEANDNDPNSQYVLGLCYSLGEEVAEDKEEAKKWYSKAAELGHCEAQVLLADYPSYDDFTFFDADDWFSIKVSETSTIEGMESYRLGRCYYDGVVVEKDLEKAKEWFDKATGCYSSNPSAYYYLGEYYYDKAIDPHAAYTYDPQATRLYGDQEKAFDSYKEVVNRRWAPVKDPSEPVGHEDSFDDPEPYDHKVRSLTKGEQLQWYRKIARIGHAWGLYSIGEEFETGERLKKNLTSATKYYSEAAQLGLVQAQHKMGVMYWDGMGVEQDLEKTIGMFIQASRHSYREDGQKARDKLSSAKMVQAVLNSNNVVAQIRLARHWWNNGEGFTLGRGTQGIRISLKTAAALLSKASDNCIKKVEPPEKDVYKQLNMIVS